ncbi:MAG: amino acid adenylation domain-containing protein [Nostoc sp.]|uniref:amino acid adenylation domain-containing protein n=1 Tax=Nostoc sp. TaxID=1180 RepID=UPI002FF5D6A8
MKSTQEFLRHLKRLDIYISLADGRLHCNAPKGALTPEIKTQLANRKADIVTWLQQNQIQPLCPVKRTENLPLSFAQARLWFLEQLDTGNTAYSVPNAYQLTGNLNIAALEQTITELLRRHEVLRTNLQAVNGAPVQVIHSPQKITLPIINLEGLTTDEQAIEVKFLLNKDASKPFDLAHEPLLRLTLVHLDAQTHVLLLNMHHIIFDAWSMGILMQELSVLYGAYLQKLPSPIPELPLQYIDFAVWERQWFKGERLEEELSYWRQKLAGITPELTLPIARSHHSQNFQDCCYVFEINPNLTKPLEQLSRSQEVTPFMLLFAAFATLLYRYSNQEDITIGFPIANRQYKETHSLIGFFVNLLVLRVKLAGNITFQEILSQARRTILEAYEHQDTPFEKVVEALHPERNINHSPLFQVMFDWLHASSSEWKLPGLQIKSLAPLTPTGRFDLSLTIIETDTGLKGMWSYNGAMFTTEAISQMTEHYQVLLAGIVTNVQQSINKLPLLTAKEKQLLTTWNTTQTDYPHTKCIHHLWEEQVDKTPNAIAVEFQNQQITYRELNEKANLLAHYLQTAGVEPGTLVGICIERSIEMIIGILGILKAGGAYVPLDPQLPTERIAYILQDTQVLILLTQQKLLAKLPDVLKQRKNSPDRMQVVCLDRDWDFIANQNKQNLVSAVSTYNLAYIIYTSGSTGQPKGTAIAHQSLVNFTSQAIKEYGIHQQDRILQFASISFDTAAEEIYPCLTTGATLVLRTEDLLSSSHQFWQCCQDWQLTVLDLPTAYWHYLTADLQASDSRITSCLRLVIIGGEQALTENLKRWYLSLKSLKNPPKLVNTYGPTEATIVTTIYPFPDSTSVEPTDWEVPIGRPIGNTQVYVLDKYLQPVPIGIPGELHIAGVSLAKGYLNRPDLTQEKFIPNPFSNSTQDTKLYKTGDLVRYRLDGNLEFIGRIDKQVKIRGFRIELGEIEAAIAQHPLICMTAVTLQEDQPGDKRLVAYITADENFLTSSIDEFLRQKLPNYMIPTIWIQLDSLPLTSNGKIDYRALPKPTKNISQDNGFVAPRNELERQIAKIWAEVLDVPVVGIKNNFFELGGHSLLAFALMNRIQQKFGKNLPLSSIFQSATVEQFAEIINQKTDSHSWSVLVKIQPQGTKPPLFLIHPGGANLLAYKHLISCMDTQRPLYGLDAKGFEEGQTPQETVEEMAVQYLEAIRGVQPEGPYLLMGWCFGGLVAFEMAQLLRSQGQKTAFLGLIDTYIRSGQAPQDDLNLLIGLSFELFGVEFPIEKLRQMEVNERIIYIFEQVKQANRLPPNFGLGRMKRLLEVNKSHDQASVKYFSQAYPGAVTLIRAREDAPATLNNPTLGWEMQADKVNLHWVGGDHLSMFHHPHVQELAKKLEFCIEQAEILRTF